MVLEDHALLELRAGDPLLIVRQAGLTLSGVPALQRPVPASTDAPSGDSFLVIISHPQAAMVGQRRALIAPTHPSEYVRAKTLCDAIDAALRFIAAVEIAALRDLDDATVRAEVAAALARHRTGQPRPGEPRRR